MAFYAYIYSCATGTLNLFLQRNKFRNNLPSMTYRIKNIKFNLRIICFFYFKQCISFFFRDFKSDLKLGYFTSDPSYSKSICRSSWLIVFTLTDFIFMAETISIRISFSTNEDQLLIWNSKAVNFDFSSRLDDSNLSASHFLCIFTSFNNRYHPFNMHRRKNKS